MADCVGIAGKIFGHRYQPRASTYERHRPIDPRVTSESATIGGIWQLSTLTDRVYHADVCERCGGIVNRQPVAASSAPETR